MEIIILGHIIGDFYFQSNKLSELKYERIACLILHCLIYTVSVSVLMALTMKCFQVCIPVIVFVTHFIIDKGKSVIENSKIFYHKYITVVFMLDQIAHIAVLYAITMKWTVTYSSEYFFIALGVLVCGKPAAIFITKVFESITSISKYDENDERLKAEEMNGNIANAGYWIGVLEREIIFFLGLAGEYSAIGFVLAAKSLARHKNFDEEGFAEKYLIGTLLSSLIAFCCVALCKL